jgi:hypothetical protein
MNNPQRDRLRLLAVALALLAAVAYLLAAGRLAVNFPYWDDYFAVLDSLNKIRSADTVVEKTALVFSGHNEHRVAWLRAVVLGCWTVQGQVDFRTLIWLGNAGLVSLAAILVAGARRSVRWPSLLALIPLVLLSPIQGKQMIWPMAAVSNYWVLAFAAAALLLLSGGTRTTFGWACLAAVAATFTSGQGLLCFPAGAVMLLMERRWRPALIWLTLMGLSAEAYFYQFSPLPPQRSLEALWLAVQYFPVAVGGAVSEVICQVLAPVWPNLRWEAALVPTIRAAAGLGLVGLIAWLWAGRYYRRNSFVSAFLLYLLLLFAVAALSRSGLGLQHAAISHYRVISASLAVLVAVALLDQRFPEPPKLRVHGAVLAGGACFCAVCWQVFYPGVAAFSKDLADGRRWFLQTQDARSLRVWQPQREQALDILWRSYLTGLMPLADLANAQGLRLSAQRLSRMGVLCRQAGSAPTPGEAGLVARLEWSGEEVLLLPEPTPADAAASAGSLRLRDGKLEYALAARRAPAVGLSPEPALSRR